MLLAPARVKGVKEPPTLISCHAYVSRLAWNPECGVNHKTLLSIKHGTAPSHAKQHERTTRILVKSIVIHLLVRTH